MADVDHSAILDIDPEAPSAAKEWNHWRRKFENLTRAAKVTEVEKLRLLVNYVSPNIYEHIRCCLTYKEALASLRTCFSKPRNEIAAQFRLFSRKQKPDESAQRYAEALQALSVDCRSACAPCREETLRGLFIAGLSKPNVRQKLLESSHLTLAEAVNQAKALELPWNDSDGDDRGLGGSISDSSVEDPDAFAATPNDSKISSQIIPVNALITKIVAAKPAQPNDSSQKSTKVEYSCYHCNARYFSKTNLLKHMHNHVDGLPVYACDWCEYKAKVVGDLNRHITKHTGERRFACELCDYKARLRKHLTRHVRVHTGEKPYACLLCGYRATQKFSLVRHVRRHHTGEKPYACGVCDFRAFSSDEVNAHKRTHTGETPYACALCDYKCAARTSLKKHVLRHEPMSARLIPPEDLEKNLMCDQCDYKTHDKHYLKRHKDKHRYEAGKEKKVTCSTCGFKSAFNYTMKIHLRTHSGVKPFKCTLCNYSAITNSLLKLHTKTKHTGEAKYSCESCSYATPVKMRLARHKLTHTGEKPHSCDICSYRAALKENLAAHRKTHTGEKWYRCGQCSYSASKKSLLSAHAKTHPKDQDQGHGQGRVDVESTTDPVFAVPEIQLLPAPNWQGGSSTAIPNLWSPGKFH